MSVFASYRMLITPLSPVHIGTGESYEPTNYVIEDGILHEFDTAAVMNVLSAADRKTLLDIGNRRPDAAMIQAVQRFFFERREALMAHATRHIPVLAGVAALYASRVGQVANKEAGGGVVLNRLEIDRTSFNPTSRLPLLYGSSLKGAIRTALLDRVNNGARATESKGLHEFQGRLFKYFDPQARPRMSLERDPMRLVQLSDAAWKAHTDLPATEMRLAVNRKKTPVKDRMGRIRPSQAEANNLYQVLECIPGMYYRAFWGQVNLQSVEGLPEQYRKNRRQLPDPALRFDIKRIARDCNAFYQPILLAENRILSERGFLDQTWRKSIELLLSSLKQDMEQGDVFLLRVGRHSGAESVTLNGVRKIKIMRGRGMQPEYADNAKTFWLAAKAKDQNEGLLPFGWMLVELLPMEAPIQERPVLKEICEPYLSSARDFATKLAEQQKRYVVLRQRMDAQRRQEEERKRQAEEEAAKQAREAEEKKARLAIMTENMRAVEAFRELAQQKLEQLRGRRERPNMGIHAEAQKLAKAALEGEYWTAEEKRALAEAIEEWLPKLVERFDRKGDWKEARKKLKLAVLKGES